MEARARIQAAKIRAATATGRSNEVLSLETDEAAVNRRNGHLSPVEPRRPRDKGTALPRSQPPFRR